MNENTETQEQPNVLLMTAGEKARRIRDRARRPYTLKSGDVVWVRSVGVDEILAEAKMPPDLVDPSDDEDVLRKKIVDLLFADERIESCFDTVITKGMLEPRVWTHGDTQPCPYDDGYVELHDLAEDRMGLFGAIFLGKKKSRDGVAAATFPGGEGTGDRPVASRVDEPADTGAVPREDGPR